MLVHKSMNYMDSLYHLVICCSFEISKCLFLERPWNLPWKKLAEKYSCENNPWIWWFTLLSNDDKINVL